MADSGVLDKTSGALFRTLFYVTSTFSTRATIGVSYSIWYIVWYMALSGTIFLTGLFNWKSLNLLNIVGISFWYTYDVDLFIGMSERCSVQSVSVGGI